VRTSTLNLLSLIKPNNIPPKDGVRFSKKIKKFNGKNVLIKEIINKSNLLLPSLLLNEATNLKIFGKYHLKNLYFPKFYKFSKNGSKIVLEREFVEGKTLQHYSTDFKILTLGKCLMSFDELSAKMNDDDLKVVSKRNSISQLFTFPIYFLMIVYLY